MAAQAWIAANAPAHSTVESSQYTPHWDLYRGIDVDDVRMPSVSGRAGVLSQVFKSNQTMVQEILQREANGGVAWYRSTELAQRHPEFIAVDSKYYSRFLDDDVAARGYQNVHDFFADLLANRLGYHIVFDGTSQSSPQWLYPQDIDFVDNRIVILQRDRR